MLIDAMTKQECREVLAHVSFGRLACSLRDQPYVVPVCLAYEPDNIYESASKLMKSRINLDGRALLSMVGMKNYMRSNMPQSASMRAGY